MNRTTLTSIAVETPDALEQLAGDIALISQTGDLFGLVGPLGAGKTTFARGFIRMIADHCDLEIPSPTFTLIQSYDDLRTQVAHADLYRLSDPLESTELGIEELLQSGIVLVEWPEMAGAFWPDDAIFIGIAIEEAKDHRIVTIEGPEDFILRVERSLFIREFLNTHHHHLARRSHLQGDASMRRYERIKGTASGDHPSHLVLMDAPKRVDGAPVRDGRTYAELVHLAGSVTPFVAIGAFLGRCGFSAPQLAGQNLQEGLLLMEDLGAEGVLDDARQPISDRYHAAILLLVKLHSISIPDILPIGENDQYRLPALTADVLQIEASIFLDWYLQFIGAGKPHSEIRQDFQQAWSQPFDKLLTSERSLVLRDYHSPNILWLAEREGIQKVGIIDYQDAILGPSTYDVASLVQDARVPIPLDLQKRLLKHYCEARHAEDGDFDEETFHAAYAVAGAQRATRLLGNFTRLKLRDGKPHYIALLPQVRNYLRACLIHDALEPVYDWFSSHTDLLDRVD